MIRIDEINFPDNEKVRKEIFRKGLPKNKISFC
jgi:hypothetical protein